MNYHVVMLGILFGPKMLTFNAVLFGICYFFIRVQLLSNDLSDNIIVNSSSAQIRVQSGKEV